MKIDVYKDCRNQTMYISISISDEYLNTCELDKHAHLLKDDAERIGIISDSVHFALGVKIPEQNKEGNNEN